MSLEEIQKRKKVIIGTDRTLKELKRGKIKKIFLASNCNKETKETVKHYAGIMEVEVEELNIPNTELGATLKKPFSISVLSY